ncbi:MAG: hypothetical protein BM564_00005 [Bacteroidetes bacterium MedPE-SWsnd-G2]|mgnify:CR=1 FL=1|nr:MAG: hypothetical protein BM564_00005 [Bacteroidetes bacterium MedPE-SWsnd-G2]
MHYPKISIVTPSYNQGKFIEDTILSVIGQFYPNLEYLIYDANSKDKTVEIIKKYEEHITYWVSEPDNGQANAINKGFNRATGDILMWLNSDDILMPNVLHYIASNFQEHGNAIFFGNCIHYKSLNPSGLYAFGSNVKNSYCSAPLKLTDSIIQPSSFWSKEVWELNGNLDEELNFGFDWEWFLRAETNNIRFIPLNKPMSLYRFHEDHKSGVGGEKRLDELQTIYNNYSYRYAKLFQLIRNERFELTLFERLLFKLVKAVFRKKKISKVMFIKKIRGNKYKGYKSSELERIKGMIYY